MGYRLWALHQKNNGFSLIELLIVVTIIGILAALAFPSYQDYQARTQASEAEWLLTGAKVPFAEFHSQQGRWPTAAASVMGSLSGKYVSIIETSGGGGTGTLTITATLKSRGVSPDISGKSVLLISSNGGKTWDCAPGTISPYYLPASCR